MTTEEDGAAPAPVTSAPLNVSKESLIQGIDSAADVARNLIVGDPVRVIEYAEAEKEAIAYRDAGYPESPVPGYIGVWAMAKQWTPRQAADDILAAAYMWRQALLAIRSYRLNGKEAVRRAPDIANAMVQQTVALQGIKTVLAQAQAVQQQGS